MSNAMKERIKKEVEKNEILCDLSSIELTEENLNFILKEIKTSPNIGEIIWKEEKNDHTKILIDQIENELISNNKRFRSFPTDHIHCLLCSHCNETEFEKDYMKSNTLFDDKKYKILKENKWQVHQVFKERGYKSVLYINKQTKNLVLAFQGIKLEVRDFFLQDSIIGSTIYSMIANKEIAPQTVYSYVHTQLAAEICKEKIAEHYSLSFTGFGFGAWLAEQAIYFSIKEFSFQGLGFDNVKAVTFESPGSKDYLEILNTSNICNSESNFELKNLNIVTYLLAPNFMNTCNQHLGKVYRVFTHKKKHFEGLNTFFVALIDRIPVEIIRKKLRKCYDENVKSNLDRYSFYLNGFMSLFQDGLNSILNAFEANTANQKRMLDWPKIVFTPSQDFKDNFKNLFDFNHVFELIPDGGIIPEKAKKFISKGVNFFMNKAVTFISENLLSGITVIINFIIEIINGNLNNEQCLNCFEYDDNLNEYNKDEKEIKSEKTDFNMKYLAHYRIEDVNLHRDILLDEKKGSIDHFLWNLYYYGKENKVLNNLKNKLLEKQLFDLRQLYEIDSSEKFETIITSKQLDENKIEIESIRFRLDRLLKINKDLKAFLHELIGLKNTTDDSIDIQNIEVVALDKHFTGKIINYF